MPSRCENCQHRIGMYDEHFGCLRWACLKLHRMVGKDVASCGAFEPKVPQVPYIPGSLPRILEVELVEEIRLHMLKVEELLEALERQPH